VWERGSAAHFTQWAEVTLSGPSFVDQVVVHQVGGSHLVADLELVIVHGDGTESVSKTGGFAETQIVDVQQNDVAKVIIRLMPGGTRLDWIRMTDIEIFGEEVYLSPLPNIASMGTCVTNDHYHGTARWSNDCPGLLDGRPVWERGSAAHFTQWAEVTLSGPSFVDQVVVHQVGGSHLVADLELVIVHGDGTESVSKTGGFAETQIVDVQQNDVAKVIIRLMPGGTMLDWIRMTDIEIFGTPEPVIVECPICDACPPGMTSTEETDDNGCFTCGCQEDIAVSIAVPDRSYSANCDDVKNLWDNDDSTYCQTDGIHTDAVLMNFETSVAASGLKVTMSGYTGPLWVRARSSSGEPADDYSSYLNCIGGEFWDNPVNQGDVEIQVTSAKNTYDIDLGAMQDIDCIAISMSPYHGGAYDGRPRFYGLSFSDGSDDSSAAAPVPTLVLDGSYCYSSGTPNGVHSGYMLLGSENQESLESCAALVQAEDSSAMYFVYEAKYENCFLHSDAEKRRTICAGDSELMGFHPNFDTYRFEQPGRRMLESEQPATRGRLLKL